MAFFSNCLLVFNEDNELGEVEYDPFQMKTAPHLPSRAPDILFVAKEHFDRLKPNLLTGAADLVVEIVSPESRGRDRGDKFYEYEEGGVREYWIIDPGRQKAEFYLLEANGRYMPALVDAENRYHSTVLKGLFLDVECALAGVATETAGSSASMGQRLIKGFSRLRDKYAGSWRFRQVNHPHVHRVLTTTGSERPRSVSSVPSPISVSKCLPSKEASQCREIQHTAVAADREAIRQIDIKGSKYNLVGELRTERLNSPVHFTVVIVPDGPPMYDQNGIRVVCQFAIEIPRQNRRSGWLPLGHL